MNKKALSIFTAALLGSMAASTAFAQTAVTQGKVTFDGELTTSTCSIKAGDEDKKVILPKISTVDLAKRGDTAGSTSFDITTTNCAADVNKVAAHFEMTNMDPDTGNLKNLLAGDTAAKNVVVQLVNSDGTGIRAGSTGRYYDVTGTGTGRGATMLYGGQYFATGQTTAGKVNTFARFTLAYQ
ncbi:fimbrial protein [Burkholderia ubonensis]|uniref:Fimbrial protein n=1 Tax=Burkholderia ubonensis TaxID=101571 RepID=A0A103RSL6_9BURK|nr:fimbrial protein [Burkholderia ubonensis]AOJ64150.1 fimbrial protein [Burkholderia ubonensis]KVG73252.1 fimbrial protein [Burkholderia ubonensis]